MLAITSLIFPLFISLAFANVSPVLLWGAHSAAQSSLKVISSDEFAKLVTPLLMNKSLVVFLEKNLKTKDLLCNSVSDGDSCFPHLQAVSQTYYPAVEDPVRGLKTINAKFEYNSLSASGKLSKPVKTEAGTINILEFEHVNQLPEHGSILQFHDLIISSITPQLNGDAFFMYASAPSEYSPKRQRRDTSDNKPPYKHKNFLLYFQSLSVTEDKNTKYLDINGMTVSVKNDTAMSITLTSAQSLTFDIILSSGYFFMKNVVYNGKQFPTPEVYAPTGFSYFCGNLTSVIYKGSVPSSILKWNYLQFQPHFNSTQNTSTVFADPWHCVGFFTSSILSGLLVVALLLTITFIGVCWMMDINTMDRFDDPKGKTISINASD